MRFFANFTSRFAWLIDLYFDRQTISDATFSIEHVHLGWIYTFTNVGGVAVSLHQPTNSKPITSYGSGNTSTVDGRLMSFPGAAYRGWWVILNAEGSDVTVTPTSSTINGGATLVIPEGAWALVYADGANWRALVAGAGSGTGDVVGPGSSTDNAVARYDSTTGKLLQNSSFIVDDTGHVTSFGGNIKFPASMVASANANTLDDYEEGTWTPAITFATNGDLSVTYSGQEGHYTKIGDTVILWVRIVTSAFTHSTASGELRISGLPFNGTITGRGSAAWDGVTKAGYTDSNFGSGIGVSYTVIQMFGSGVGRSNLAAADMPSGGAPFLGGSLFLK